MNKKGQVSTGMVTGLVMGIAGLVIGVIVAFVIVSTLISSDMLPSLSKTVANETDGFINLSGYTLAGASSGEDPRDFVVTSVWNKTTDYLWASGNYTVNSATGVLTNVSESEASTFGYLVNISYTYTIDGAEEGTVDKMSGNFTSGVDEISSKLPTVLLITAIILILGILAVLVAVWQRMRLGQGGL